MADFLIKRGDLRDTAWTESRRGPLAPGAARLKVEAFALTANNVTYATFGEAMGYWNFFPAADPAFGRVPVWGFATVKESNADGVAVGARVYGYLPISESFDVTPVRAGKESFMDGAEWERWKSGEHSRCKIVNTFRIAKTNSDIGGIGGFGPCDFDLLSVEKLKI